MRQQSESEDEVVESDEEVAESDEDELPTKGQRTSNIIVQTSFDSYFTHTASRAQTSSNVFSNLVLPLSAEEYNTALSSAKPRLKSIQPIITTDTPLLTSLFSRFLIELEEGFNILCYGYGSKRQLLNKFATEFCSKRGHVVIANGFQPEFTIKDLLNQIENVPGIQQPGLSSTMPEKQAQRISKFFYSSSKADLYIIIHNIDSPVLRAPRSRSILSLLALTPHIHITASIDHINAPLIWSSSESSTRKPTTTTTTAPTSTSSSVVDADTIPPPRGYSWLYHDLTTLSPYDFELTFIDRTSLSSAHGGGPRKRTDTSLTTTATLSTSSNMTETAAIHILASVTQKAQKLFILLGNKQLESIEELSDTGGVNKGTGASAAPTPAPVVDPQTCSMGYDTLFNLARENFIATSEIALRALLGEYRDHGLVVSVQSTSSNGEHLWIPLRKERLTSVLQRLQAQS